MYIPWHHHGASRDEGEVCEEHGLIQVPAQQHPGGAAGDSGQHIPEKEAFQNFTSLEQYVLSKTGLTSIERKLFQSIFILNRLD